MNDGSQKMVYEEREALKQFARQGANSEETLIMIAQWMRHNVRVPFSDYAANWTAANLRENLVAMRKQWPLKGTRHIADNGSDWHVEPV